MTPDDVLERLEALREHDAPTHGGRVLSYVYDSGRPELDELAAAAARAVQSVNGLDPTTFPSVARLEADLVRFARDMLHGDDDVVGSVTSGGTESCLLAVRTARDLWRARGGEGVPRLVLPVTAHAAFRKAAHLFCLELDEVPVDIDTGAVRSRDIIARLASDVALVVVSAPSYPHAALDPVVEVAAASAERGIACHVDACIGGFALPWWPDVAPWDFSVAGVTSVSADLHKFGYAPKGVSVLLHRGRERHRAQYFATTDWPGYPVVNPTLLGSKSAGALAAAWAIVQHLDTEGFRALTESARRATEALRTAVSEIEGLRVVGNPVGPLLAITTDSTVEVGSRVDPHHWADAVRARGWLLQQQPALEQSDGSRLPRTTHLTVTAVTERRLAELVPDLVAAADEVRGTPAIDGATLLASLPPELGETIARALTEGTAPSTEAMVDLLAALGVGPGGVLPAKAAPLTALIETLPGKLVEGVLIELLAGMIEP